MAVDRRYRFLPSFVCILLLAFTLVPTSGQDASVHSYAAHIVEGGPPLTKPLAPQVVSGSKRTLLTWLRVTADLAPQVIVAELGSPEQSLQIVLENLHPGFRANGHSTISPQPVSPDSWHFMAVVEEGEQVNLYVDGQLAKSETLPSSDGAPAPVLTLAPTPLDSRHRFAGDIDGFMVLPEALSAEALSAVYKNVPDFAAHVPEENAKPWPLQTHQQAGYTAPQSLDLLPSGAPAQKPTPALLRKELPPLVSTGSAEWTLAARWKLLNADAAHTPPSSMGAVISTPGFPDGYWLTATVPGTILTTLIDRGIYPDPDYGLNNLAIPESIHQHDWWYRVEFRSPLLRPGRRLTLCFAGVNYAAEVWFNGTRLGEMRGAFRRGEFDVTRSLHAAGPNALAVRISPPPHPGIPQEQSLKAGPGENGGEMVIDGPTFVATEGWDWIPAMRDRNSGLWQAVTLRANGPVTLGDPQVVTRLPLPEISSADVELSVPVRNSTKLPVHVALMTACEGVSVRLPAVVPPGESTLRLLPSQFPQLHLTHPRLWWPNGYGSPELYHLKLRLETAGGVSDERNVTFGVREITYELSLFDHAGKLQRVEARPQESLGKGFDAVDVHHASMRETATSWASSITPQAEGTSVIRAIDNTAGLTDLVIKVNGVRIAVRGGNWGMDDSRKRVSREHLEPYFRLHREANLNIIRNWVGQDTEETFFDLADEYGMLVWNDFWASTQNYNAEPGDLELFVANARDVVRRDRNHPSIALWCGRNEGVPPPALNDALITMLREEDGSRFYSPSSNMINLRGSGPYSWQEPSLYFSKLNRGFSVELGISSFPTREAFEQAIAPSDRWPISDAWAYHDWHQAGGGNTHELMKHVEAQLGLSTSLNDFERRIQLFNYVDHQAIFEGFYQHLWTPNSGRMIWMTHPSWPSTNWQMYSSDYDTQASFYAIKKANAPLHVQMDLSDGTLAVVNTTRSPRSQLHVTARAYSADNVELASISKTVDAPANTTTATDALHFAEVFAKAPLAFVRLELSGSSGDLIADNFYWIARDESSFRTINDLPQTPLEVTAHEDHEAKAAGSERVLQVQLINSSSAPAVAAKLTLLGADGKRVLPVYYSDNYVSLLPGEKRTLTVHVPRSSTDQSKLHFSIRGWNIAEQAILSAP